ncbi:branched-chain amino acid ABC transporter permease [Archaeoglobus profundus]|uniref:Inner-membrane translocator n=1 Tax=Archaeoglobus profundus (strain DSM 5631 / JCM 9629 / NBRC 100127 / Av18) TaxID=572546 RepID=D2RE26_ARCPA|nr:branched-chain amino acid ABC transporter permease [Archaeoglobus profundus]ADB58370.1 inner-membrane translocator [Archaeoglobus profundus DSM 5631]
MALIEGALIYANLMVLLALGLTITYITTSVPNFAQGSFAVFGSYVALTFLQICNIHPYHSLPLCFLFGGLLGLATYLIALRPLIGRGASVVTLMIATLAWDILLLGVIGAYSGFLSSITKKSTTNFLFTPLDFPVVGLHGRLVVSSLVILLTIVFLTFLLYKTKFGIALRASMENPALAEIMGINVEYTRLFSWFLSGALAGLAGGILPFKQQIFPVTGDVLIVSIFASSIVGGLSSLLGAVIGGYIVGLSESLASYALSLYFGPAILSYSKVIPLSILIATLLIAPKGIVSIRWRRLLKWLGR